MKTRADWLGANIDGKFKIVSLLSEGGMGVTFLAEQEELGRKVVLKILHLNLANDPEGRERFIREAQLLGSLQHSHLVQVYSAGVYADEFPYIAMEYLEGKTLEEYLRASGPIDWKKACRITMQVCDAMAYCHAAGVIHRDLKPANIIILQNTQSDFVKVIDFGLAKTLDGNKNTLTATGLVVGSPHYMSPEGCAGQKPDSRSDIYSLGCVLYEMLAGRAPFISESPFELFSAHKADQPVEPSKHVPNIVIPSALDGTVLKALEKEPLSRFASMEEFSQNLAAVLSDRELSFDLKELTVYRRKAKKPYSKLRLGLLAALFSVLLLSAIFFSAKVTSSRNKQVASTINAATKDLNNVELAIDEMEKARLQQDKRKVLEQAMKSLRIFVRELLSSRDQKTTLPRELKIMARMRKHGLILMDVENFKYVRNFSKQHLMDFDPNERAENLHNRAEFQTLEGMIFEGAGGHASYAINSYGAAALSYSRAKEFDNANSVLALATKVAKNAPELGKTVPAIYRCWIDIGTASTFAFQDKTKFKKYVAQLTPQIESLPLTSRSECLAQLGWICYMCGEKALAKTQFEAGVKLNLLDPDWFTNECVAGLAQLYEEEGEYEKALALQTTLAERFTSGLISRHTKAVNAISRLHALIAAHSKQ